MFFVFYKLKDIQNIKEILEISKYLGLNIIFIPREDTFYYYENLKKFYKFEMIDYDNFLRISENSWIAFIETFGNKYIFEENLGKYQFFVFGSEDKGIDICDIKKAKNYDILKIPILKESYNVVSSFVMIIRELRNQGLLKDFKYKTF